MLVVRDLRDRISMYDATSSRGLTASEQGVPRKEEDGWPSSTVRQTIQATSALFPCLGSQRVG